MAKKIYVATLANGSVQEVTSKKAVLALEDIIKVTLNDKDVTSEFIKEDNDMVEVQNIEAQVEEIAVEEAQAEETPVAEIEEVQEAPETPAVEDIATLLFTASRGNSKQFNWYQVVYNTNEEKVKVKGCAALLPLSVANTIADNKFVSWMPQEMFQQSVAEDKPVRGMASTVSDIFTRYCKVNEVKGADKVRTVLNIFKDILSQIEAGTTSGNWTRPEPIQEEAPAEEPAQETAPTETPEEDIISTDLADIEIAG